jgi:hypothetical protein
MEGLREAQADSLILQTGKLRLRGEMRESRFVHSSSNYWHLAESVAWQPGLLTHCRP